VIPVYKIETYTGTTLDYTITSDAVSINTHERVTDAVGQFTIVLPTDTRYEAIAVHDKVNIYLGYDSVPTSPTFVGRVQKIEGAYSDKQGYFRKISGLALGEILLRRIKSGHYSGTDASVIAAELAADLSLGTGDIVTDTAEPPLEFVDQTYFDALQALSDIWISAGVQLKKEFYVDAGNDLVYQSRPLRTVNVETLSVGTNILDYTVRRSLENLKNSILVYGNWDELLTTTDPVDENWTEPDASCTNWTALAGPWTGIAGTLSRDGADKQVGSYSVKCVSAGAGILWDVDFYRNLKPDYAFVSGNARTITKSFSRLHFQQKVANITQNFVDLLAPDTTNYYWRAIGGTGAWIAFNITLPTTDALGVWTASGSPQANFVTGVRFMGQNSSTFDMRVDDLAFQGGRFSHKTSDATSIAAYGQRDLVVIDDSLKSAGQCEARAKTLLYQRKDPTVEIEMSTAGNTNILVGDRLALVLPRESISGNYDVTSVDHSISSDGFFTKFIAVEGTSNRYALTQSPVTEISRLKAIVRCLSRDSKTIR
jgi:hypothetical protein